MIGTGPWMLERYDPNVKAVFVRHPGYFLPGLPYAEAVEVSIDRDPASRFAGWLSGKYDFGPEYQQVVRRLDLETARQRKPGIQTAEYVWFTGGYSSLKLDQEPFKDVRVRRAMHRCLNWRETLETNAFSQGHGVPNAAVPAAAVEWAIPIDQLPPEGRELYDYDIASARKLLAQAGIPAGFKVPVETTGGYGPDYLDAVQIDLKGWKDAGIIADLKLKEYGAFISTTIYGKFDKMMRGLRGSWIDPDAYLYRAYMPGQPLNSSEVDDPRLTEMIKLQRRTFDVAKRREIIYDIQRHASQHVYYLYNPSVKVVSAWEPHVKNWAPNNGFDYGGRMMAALARPLTLAKHPGRPATPLQRRQARRRRAPWQSPLRRGARRLSIRWHRRRGADQADSRAGPPQRHAHSDGDRNRRLGRSGRRTGRRRG